MSEEIVMENVTYDELKIGQKAERTHTVTETDIRAFASISGDINPAHLDHQYAEGTMFKGVIVHGMWGAAFISALLGTQLPGPGTIYLEQTLHFVRPVRPGDTVTATLTVTEKDDEKKRVRFDCAVRNQNGKDVITGSALVMAPTEKIKVPSPKRPVVAVVDALIPALKA